MLKKFVFSVLCFKAYISPVLIIKQASGAEILILPHDFGCAVAERSKAAEGFFYIKQNGALYIT